MSLSLLNIRIVQQLLFLMRRRFVPVSKRGIFHVMRQFMWQYSSGFGHIRNEGIPRIELNDINKKIQSEGDQKKPQDKNRYHLLITHTHRKMCAWIKPSNQWPVTIWSNVKFLFCWLIEWWIWMNFYWIITYIFTISEKWW